MNDAAAAPSTPKRVFHFGRTYDYDAATCKVAALAKDGVAVTVEFDKLPPRVQRAFGLQSYVDFVTGHGNDVMREGVTLPDGQIRPATIEDGVAALIAAAAECEAGTVEFREGKGMGLASQSAAALMGRALVELGKTYVAFKGQKHTFEKAEEAGLLLRAIWDDTGENTIDGHKLNGRQYFTALSKIPEVSAKLESYRKPKPPKPAPPTLDIG